MTISAHTKKTLRSLSPLLLIAAVWFSAAAALVGVDHWHHGAEESARGRFFQIHDAENRVAVERVNNLVGDLYRNLRTVSRLPGVRRADWQTQTIEPDSREAVREIFDLLRTRLAVSQLVITPISRGQTPVAFDAFLGDSGQVARLGLTQPVVAQLAVQADMFQRRFPTLQSVDGLEYPAVGSPQVNVSPSTPRSFGFKTKPGMVYSLPIYDDAGRLKGMVGAVIPIQVLADHLQSADMAIYAPKWDILVRRTGMGLAFDNPEYIRALRPLPRSPFSRIGQLRFSDVESEWHYWVAVPEATYMESHDYQELERFTGLLVVFILTVALFITLLIAASIRIRDQLEEENLELEKVVQARTADLLRARRLEAIGEMAAGIAHEINTPTQFVGDNLTFLRRVSAQGLDTVKELHRLAAEEPQKLLEYFAGPEAKKLLKRNQEAVAAADDSLEGVGRIRDIVRSLREFAHPGVQGRETANINRIVENAITVTRNEWKNVARIELRLTESLDAARCSPGEIGQVLVNLIVNSAHAIKGAGRSLDQGVIRITTGRSGDFLTIKVYDNGCGISEDHKRQVWDQYFTTKAVGVGTGMGLAIVRNIVERHEGTITLESELGCWTEFVLNLPYVLPIDQSSQPEAA